MTYFLLGLDLASLEPRGLDPRLVVLPLLFGLGTDRKSTRLNSSH